jgi:glycosyltransferase involved in cell wall biosynthesis
MGGFRVVYEYSNQLVERGHEVTVLHARAVKSGPRKLTLYEKLRDLKIGLVTRHVAPTINWHNIDPRVKLLFSPDTDALHVPDGDVIFATAWNTVAPVLNYFPSKGTKFYLIQHYETWLGTREAPKDLVDETWRSPLNKIVVSKWLLALGRELGAEHLEYIPNAVDHDRYRVLVPVLTRPKQVAMMFSHVPFKGSKDGIAALEIAKKRHPDLSAVFFGTGRDADWIPKWVRYHRDPPQDFIVREIYNKSSIFLSPSLAEGFALPPAEAACCGCAVVATNSGGIADFIEHGQSGLLSAPENAQALGENLNRVLDDDRLRITLAEAGGRRLSTFTWEKSAEMLESVMESSRKLDRDLQNV